MGPFDAVILDFDGVLAQSVDVKTRAFAELYEPYGPDIVSRVVAYHLAHGGLSRFDKFRHFHRVFLGAPLGATDEAALGARFSALVEDAVADAPWVPGAREFLETYHRRLPLFVASGTPEDELRRIIARRSAAHYFADIGGAPLTKADIIAAVVRRGGFQHTRVLMVGDSSTDYEGARSSGVHFLGIGREGSVFPDAIAVLPDLTGLGGFVAPSEAR